MPDPTLARSLRALAEKAGVEIFPLEPTPHERRWHKPDGKNLKPFPGYTQEGLSDAECTVVLGWLAKAGYWTTVDGDLKGLLGCKMQWFSEDKKTIHGVRRFADTLPSALVAAVLALEVE